MTRAQPRAIVFDLGGVVFDWQPVRLIARELRSRIVDYDDARRWAGEIFQSYGGDWFEFDRGTLGPDELIARIAHRTGLSADEMHRIVEALPHTLVPLPASTALLQRLAAQGRRLHFLSNMPAPYAEHLLREHGRVFELFSGGVFSCDVKLVKPERAIFDYALNRFGLGAGDALLLDDYAANIDAARAADWHALHFRDAAQAERALLEFGLD